MSPSAAFGLRLGSQVGVGVGFKWVRADLAPAAVTRDGEAGVGTAPAFDLGLLLRFPEARTNIGVNFQNIGPGLTFIDEEQSDPLPRNLKIGVGVWPLAHESIGVVVAADLNKPFVSLDDGPILNFGGELSMWSDLYEFAFRAGWVYEGWFQELDPINGPSFGLGGRFGMFSVDIASRPRAPDLDGVWVLSIGVEGPR